MRHRHDAAGRRGQRNGPGRAADQHGDLVQARLNGLFYQSLARRSAALRRAGLVVIGIAVAKVFLVDIGEMNGLVRVGALLVLGLSLAGLAWLNRWAAGRTREVTS